MSAYRAFRLNPQSLHRRGKADFGLVFRAQDRFEPLDLKRHLFRGQGSGASSLLPHVVSKDGRLIGTNTDWLGGTVALDDDGFVLTGQRAGAEGILETSVPGVFAVGDVRSGSVKRCATAVGEGAMVVRFVHERFSADVVEATPAAGS